VAGLTAFETAAAIGVWLCAAGVLYAYAGYPAAVWLLSRLFGREREWPANPEGDVPFVSVLIAAHDEEAVIGERLRNALDFDYPADRIEIVVASDGSRDRTVEIARGFGDPRIRVLAYPWNRGKAQTLNDAMTGLRGDIVVLSDANTAIERFVVRRFVRWFKDPRVGVVVGRLVLTDPATGRNVDGLYWRYETFLKVCESRLGALLGANGAIYAIRRELFTPLRRDTLVDDFVLPLLIKLRTGCDIIYDTQAVAHEASPAEMGAEFKRRSRIGAGGFQSLGVLWPLLRPSQGWVAFAFLSHKVLRWSCPFLLIALLGCNVVVAGEPRYAALLAAQGLLYGVSAAGLYVPGSGLASRVVRLATMFTSMNLALLVGFWQWASRTQQGTWQRTAR
jgi:cellulose synthase/poly-beta-1,6-N-acetylglucosamine synthase-like glycosyltransferase